MLSYQLINYSVKQRETIEDANKQQVISIIRYTV